MTDTFNDSIGFMLREQMEKIVNREDLIQSFFYDTSGSEEPILGRRSDRGSLISDERRAKGMFYGVDGGEDYKLGIFIASGEFRIALFDNDYDTLQTASAVWYQTVNGSHTAVSLREGHFEFFGTATDAMKPASDDDRGAAVMKLMMINEAAK